MTILENSIRVNAPAEKVWKVLASLDALHHYDPAIKKSEIISPSREGLGASRRCELTPGGWFKEKVTEWKPGETLAFELLECTLPVRRLKYRYSLSGDGGGTLVQQRMEYQLKFGPFGRLMDAFMVRKKWDAGVKGFFAGLKQYVEAGEGSPDERWRR